jgi:hypothetical protein
MMKFNDLPRDAVGFDSTGAQQGGTKHAKLARELSEKPLRN